MLKSPLRKLLLLALILAGVWYFWTPRRSWDRFLTAVVMADSPALQDNADFIALRANLKSDLKLALESSDENGSLSGTLTSSLLDPVVNMTLTPRGIAELVTSFGTRSPQAGDLDSFASGSVTSFRYRSHSRVDVQIRPAGSSEDASGVFTLRRDGLRWRVSRIWSAKLAAMTE
jgi:hypothetical protein